MEKINYNCCICGVDDTSLIFQNNGFNLVKCKICGLIYVNPRLSDGTQLEIYSDKYFNIRNMEDKYSENGNDIIRVFRKKSFKLELDRLENFNIKNGRVLDIGCGEGYFLEVAQEKGWEIYGVEVSEFASKVAEGRLKRKIFNGFLRDAHFPDKYFDLITLFDTIEHLSDPFLELKEINRILKNGGFIYIQTPNIGGLFARLMGKRWFQIKPEEHIYYFNKKNIRTILEKSEFSIVSFNTYGKVLTIEYVQHILALTNTTISKVIKLLFSRLPFYRIPFYMKTGHLSVLGKKL